MNIGTDYFNGKDVSIDLTKHTNIEGGSGMGKSSIIANLFIDWVRNGGGGILIDPHGDVADLVTTMMPKSRLWDFIWLDPDAKKSIPLNPFHFKTPEELELAKEAFFTILKAMAGSAWGDESARVIINAIDAVCAKFAHPSPVHVFRFLADDQFRKKVLAETDNPLLKMFREQYDEKLPTATRWRNSARRLTKWQDHAPVHPSDHRPGEIVGLPRHHEQTERGRVQVVERQAGGRDRADFGFSHRVHDLDSRAPAGKAKRPAAILIVVDETHNFVHGGRFSSLLAEGRKYGVSVVSATQGMYQLPFARDLLANCGNQIILNASGEDAELMAKNWGHDIAANITDLPRYHFYLRSFQNDNPIVRMVKAAPPISRRGDEARPTKLIKHSLERWGTDRRAAEAKIMKFLAA